MNESQETKRFGLRRKAVESNGIFAKMIRKAKRNPVASFLIDILAIVAAALILSLLIKTFLIRSFYIPSGSMMDTLQINDRIIVNELVPDLIPISRGDVVVFSDPGGWLYDTPSEVPTNGFVAASEWFLSIFGLTAPDSNQHLVKRVIGIAGDRVICCDAKDRLTINGKAIKETYVIDGTKPSDLKFNVVVPPNSFWVMGDNRPNSEDSRFHRTLPGKGFVPKESIVGRAFVVSWPFANWAWIDNYQNVFKDVPNN